MARDLMLPADVHLSLQGRSKEEVLRELTARLGLGDENEAAILRILLHREQSGSTGIGRGIAVPHCRTPMVPRLRVLYGRRPGGVRYDALDGQPVEHLFLLIAPPVEVSNDYLATLARIARIGKHPEGPARLAAAATREEILQIVSELGG